MKSEFSLAFNQICAEYSLPREVVLEAVRAALATAYRRDWKVPSTQNVTAEINLDTGLARIFIERVVVDVVEDPLTQITVEDAEKVRSNAAVDDIVWLMLRRVTSAVLQHKLQSKSLCSACVRQNAKVNSTDLVVRKTKL